MKNILHNVDDRQIPVMTSSRKEINNTFVLAGLCHKIIQNDQISLRYVQVIWFVYIVRDAFIKLYSRHRSYHIKISGLPLTITPDDTLSGMTYSFLDIFQQSFYPDSLATLRISCYDTSKGVLQHCNSIHRKSLPFNTGNFIRMTTFLWRRRLLAFANVLPQTSHSCTDVARVIMYIYPVVITRL